MLPCSAVRRRQRACTGARSHRWGSEGIRRNVRTRIVVLTCLVVFAACGDGGSSASRSLPSSDQIEPTPATVPSTSSTPDRSAVSPLTHPPSPPSVKAAPVTAPVAPTFAPTTNPTATTAPSAECLRPLPFRLTYLPRGFSNEARPGDGGAITIADDGSISAIEPPDLTYVHYAAQQLHPGAYINFTVSRAERATTTEPMIVMNQPAEFGEVEDGYIVTFDPGDLSCAPFSMLTYGVSAEDTRLVAEGLASAVPTAG